jgi:hypothetical protein
MTQAEVTFDELHAEYLREIASKVRAEAEVERLRAARVEQNDEYLALQQEYEHLRRGLAGVRQLVDQQADDAGLWFFAQTPTEAYVQQELRKLHAAVEALAREKANYV